MKAKKLLSILLALAVICTTVVMPVMAAEENSVETTYMRDGDFLFQIEFNSRDEISYNGKESVTIETDTDGNSIGKFVAESGRLDWTYGTSSNEYTALVNALNNGPVAFEVRYKVEDNANDASSTMFTNLLQIYKESTLNVLGTKAENVAAGDWHTVGVVLDYSNNSFVVNDIQVNEVHRMIDTVGSVTTAENLLSGGIKFLLGKGSVTYIDYIRAYPVASTDSILTKDTFTPSYSVKDVIYDENFDTAYNADNYKTYRNKLPEQMERGLNSNSVVLVNDSTSYHSIQSFLISDTDAAKIKLTNAMKGVAADESAGIPASLPEEIAFEARFKMNDTTSEKRIFSPLISIANGAMKICGNSYPITVDTWYEVAFVLDFNGSTATLKKLKINGEYQSFTTTNSTTVDSILSHTYNSQTVLLPAIQNRVNGDSTKTMHIDYLQVYTVADPIVETAYKRGGDFLVDYEFSDASETLNIPIAEYDNKTYEGVSAAKFNPGANNYKDWYIFNGTSEENTKLKNALKAGPVAFEVKYLKPATSNKLTAFFASLFSGEAGSSIRFSNQDQYYYTQINPLGEWNTLTTVLDYSSGSIDVADLMLNGNHKIVEKANHLSDLDSFLNLGLRFIFYGDTADTENPDKNYTYIDYLRVYPVASDNNILKKDTFVPEYEPVEYLYDADFDSALNTNSIKTYSNSRYVDMDRTAGESSMLFDNALSTGMPNLQSMPVSEELLSAIQGDAEAGISAKELVFETRFKVNETSLSRKIFAPIVMMSDGKIDILGNTYDILKDTWYKLVLVVDFDGTNVKIKQIKLNDEFLEIPTEYTLKTPEDVANYKDNAKDITFLATVQAYDNMVDGKKMWVDYLKIYTIEKIDSLIASAADGTAAESSETANYITIAKNALTAGAQIVAAYYNSNNLMIGTNSFEITSADLAENVVTKALTKPEGAEDVKVFVFTNYKSLSPASISPLTID